MAYDEALAARVRKALADVPLVTEKKMFGGICFLVAGNMTLGVLKEELIVRVGPDLHDALVVRPGVRPFDFGPRPSRGMLFVAPTAIAKAHDLEKWIDRALAFVTTLPAKEKPAEKATVLAIPKARTRR